MDSARHTYSLKRDCICLTDIACCAAWTSYFIHNSASDHFLYRWFKRGEDTFEFAESHNNYTWDIDFVKHSYIILSAFPTILHHDGDFLGFLILRWLGIRRETSRRSDDGIKSLFDDGHIESRWILVAFQDSLGFLTIIQRRRQSIINLYKQSLFF